MHFPRPFEKKNRLGNIDKLYQGHLTLDVPVLAQKPGEYTLHINYQGCAKNGFCYPPQDKMIQLSFDKDNVLFEIMALNKDPIDTLTKNDSALKSSTLDQSPAEAIPQTKASVVQSFTTNSDHIEAVFQLQHPLMVLLMFAGFGLLLSFTPCVLPMIPVLSGLIVRHGHNLSTRKAFFLSLSYVLGMSITYALIGAILAALGANLQVIMQLPIVIVIMSLIFALLAFSMFGLYELTLPMRLQVKFAQLTRNQANGHYWNAAFMGALSTLVLSPCVTPPLVGALGYIMHSGNILMGSLALFALGLGMGAPLLLIGISSGKWLPKAGRWMNTVKAFFGILLLSVSLYLLSRALPAHVMMLLWSVLLVLSGIFAGALESVQHPIERLFKGVGILSLSYGLLILSGFALDNTDPLHPLKGIALTAPSIDSQRTVRVETIPALNLALKHARGKPVMLDFYADWCTSCKVMEATTLKDPAILNALEKIKVIIVDLSGNGRASRALMARFNVIAPPTFVFLNANGEELTNLRLIGDVSRQVFHGQLAKIPVE